MSYHYCYDTLLLSVDQLRVTYTTVFRRLTPAHGVCWSPLVYERRVDTLQLFPITNPDNVCSCHRLLSKRRFKEQPDVKRTQPGGELPWRPHSEVASGTSRGFTCYQSAVFGYRVSTYLTSNGCIINMSFSYPCWYHVTYWVKDRTISGVSSVNPIMSSLEFVEYYGYAHNLTPGLIDVLKHISPLKVYFGYGLC